MEHPWLKAAAEELEKNKIDLSKHKEERMMQRKLKAAFMAGMLATSMGTKM